jgi:hypothetical protein
MLFVYLIRLVNGRLQVHALQSIIQYCTGRTARVELHGRCAARSRFDVESRVRQSPGPFARSDPI